MGYKRNCPASGDFSHTGISLHIINLAVRSSIAAWVGGAQHSIFHVNEPKKVGARSTRAHKIRPVISVYLFVILFVCLSVCLSLRNAALLFGTVIFKMTRKRG